MSPLTWHPSQHPLVVIGLSVADFSLVFLVLLLFGCCYLRRSDASVQGDYHDVRDFFLGAAADEEWVEVDGEDPLTMESFFPDILGGSVVAPVAEDAASVDPETPATSGVDEERRVVDECATRDPPRGSIEDVSPTDADSLREPLLPTSEADSREGDLET